MEKKVVQVNVYYRDDEKPRWDEPADKFVTRYIKVAGSNQSGLLKKAEEIFYDEHLDIINYELDGFTISRYEFELEGEKYIKV